MNPVLEFRNVERRFKDGDDLVYALRDASFSIDAGEFVAVMGPSGSGKSTLLNLSGGLDVPTAGHGSGSLDAEYKYSEHLWYNFRRSEERRVGKEC